MISDAFRETAEERWRIYCMTPHPDSTLMWSHYADNHRGICLEFDARYQLFAMAWQVLYRGAYPTWSLFGMADHLEILITKSNDWQYENEYRIIARTERDTFELNHKLPTVVDGCFLELPHGSLLSVIAGCEADHNAVRAVVAENMPGLAVEYVVREPNSYRLSVDPNPSRRPDYMNLPWPPLEFRPEQKWPPIHNVI